MMHTHSQRGFTFIEMMVSLGIFSIVMTIAMAAFFNLLSLDRQVRATNDVVGNLDFAVDSMERAIQTGTNYQCGGWAAVTAGRLEQSVFTLTDYQGRTVTYLLRSDGAIGVVLRCRVPRQAQTQYRLPTRVSTLQS